MRWVYDDGGRKAAGYPGEDLGGCVTRAIALATRQPYRQVYDDINAECWARDWRPSKSRNSAPTGVAPAIYGPYLRARGWVYAQVKHGRERDYDVHFNDYELPHGALIVQVRKHLCYVQNGVLYDTYDASLGGRETVIGYWQQMPLDNNVIML